MKKITTSLSLCFFTSILALAQYAGDLDAPFGVGGMTTYDNGFHENLMDV